MAKQPMLKFVKIDREMPQNALQTRGTKILTKSMLSSQPKKQKNKRVVVANAGYRIANRIVRCTTTSLTGCA